MSKPDDPETARRVTMSIATFRSKPAEAAQKALTKEVEIVVDADTRVYLARKLAPLD